MDAGFIMFGSDSWWTKNCKSIAKSIFLCKGISLALSL